MADSATDFVELNSTTGSVRSLRDPETGEALINFDGAPELELNGVPLDTTLVSEASKGAEHNSVLSARHYPAYGAGAMLQINRYVVLGGVGLHTGKPNSAHIRYVVQRKPWREWTEDDELSQLWGPPLEAPLRVDNMSALCGRTDWFGARTRMRAALPTASRSSMNS